MAKKRIKIPDNQAIGAAIGNESSQSIHSSKRIKQIAILGSLVLVYILVYLYIFDSKIDLNGDNMAYYHLGRSMAEGHGFTTIWEPGFKPHNHFPPGYPAMMASLMWLGFRSIILFKIINGILLAASILVFYLFSKRLGVSDCWAYFIGLCLIANIHLLRSATIIMSEIPFLFPAVLILYLMTRIDFDKPIFRDYTWMVVTLLLGGLFYIRVTALSALLGVLAFYIFRKQWRHAVLTILGFVLLVVPWILNSSGNTNMQAFWYRNPYQPSLGTISFSDLIHRFLNNCIRYLSSEIPSIFYDTWSYTDRTHSFSGWIIGILILGLLIYGIFKIDKYRILVIGYLAGSFGISLLWPEAWFGVRFINNIIPLIILLTFWGLYRLLKYIFPKAHPVWLFPLLLINLPGLNALNQTAVKDYPMVWKSYIQMAEYCKANLPDSVVIATRKPTIFHHFAQRYSLMYAFLENDKEFIGDLKERSVDYVVLDRLGYSSTTMYLLPAIQNNQDYFQIIANSPNQAAVLFRFVSSP
ncbi:MAG: hypothetical protein KBA26_02190 [Candidatus Delongbacteria bacterium]|nr:hypothetical protein [Candidatus Delongbacteria bacterium]